MYLHIYPSREFTGEPTDKPSQQPTGWPTDYPIVYINNDMQIDAEYSQLKMC